ncbi:unnamed protein product [Nippostrongylus brasiliensis]|uniref:Neprilysin n=1 Tax=Nippostrongylus brasiliensis TaxID=27835 RepID=A0A0N4XWE1_NIPBR|nr:unnamed protein product [Nippostrongylus brasiliensis]
MEYFSRIFYITLYLRDVVSEQLDQCEEPCRKMKNDVPSSTNSKLSEYVRSSLNYKVDPCDNFYQFACGNWKSNAPPPESLYDETSSLYLHMDRYTEQKRVPTVVEDINALKAPTLTIKLITSDVGVEFKSTQAAADIKKLINFMRSLYSIPKITMDDIAYLRNVTSFDSKLRVKLSDVDRMVTKAAANKIDKISEKLLYDDIAFDDNLLDNEYTKEIAVEHAPFLQMLDKFDHINQEKMFVKLVKPVNEVELASNIYYYDQAGANAYFFQNGNALSE